MTETVAHFEVEREIVRRRGVKNDITDHKVKKNIFEVKELLELEVPSGRVIKTGSDTTQIIRCKMKGKDEGKPTFPCSFGKFPYFGICDSSSDINMASYEVYEEIKHEVCNGELEIIDTTIILSNSKRISGHYSLCAVLCKFV